MVLDPITKKVLATKILSKAKVRGKKVLVRVDYNVPIKDGKVTDDSRIVASIPTIKKILSMGASQVFLVTHLGRPEGYDLNYSVGPIVPILSKLLRMPIAKLQSCDPTEVMTDCKVVMLENVRFYAQEEKNDKNFSEKLACFADVFVNDAFGTSHRAHASTAGVTKFIPSYVGLLMEKELRMLGSVSEPKKPLVLVLGFSKISDKIVLLEKLLQLCDHALIGGAACFTFLAAQGYGVGKSRMEKEYVAKAKQLLKKYKTKILLPLDFVCADSLESSKRVIVSFDKIPAGLAGFDIGPKTVKLFDSYITKSKTLFWNGPVGVFEKKPYDAATNKIAKTIATTKTMSIIGGGDTVSAIENSGYGKKMSHLSTGGGASLAFFEGTLPAIKAVGKSK